MDEEPKAVPVGLVGKQFDIYTGDTIGQLPLAKIKSHTETILPPGKAKKAKKGLLGGIKRNLSPGSL
jgi:hypothetical protein